ncbi:MAG TPA: hypothetical protein ENN05_04480, partial [Deltaproteobacteria bacterium]|nr:hypothetical protein [Deltaproteobacteria bacterium]
MICKKIVMFVMGFGLFFATRLNASLIDKGESKELFSDDISGLYWYDPSTFSGWIEDELDAFVKANTTWKQAGYSEILSLICSMSGPDNNEQFLPGIMGAPTHILPGIFSGWVGVIDSYQGFAAAGIFFDTGSLGNNLLVELYSTHENVSAGIGVRTHQIISAAILYGAWLYTESDPMVTPAPVP